MKSSDDLLIESSGSGIQLVRRIVTVATRRLIGTGSRIVGCIGDMLIR